MPREPTPSTKQRLFALSRNRCASPGCPTLLVDPETGALVGAACHITGAKPGSPRYDPEQTDSERHGIGNLIAMCGTHHLDIDNPARVAEFPVELFQALKRAHERGESRDPARSGGTVESVEAALDRHRAGLRAITARSDPHAGGLEFRIRVAPLLGGVNVRIRERVVQQAQNVARVQSYPRASPGRVTNEEFCLQLGVGQNFWIGRDGRIDYHQLIADPAESAQSLCVPFADLFGDLLHVLRFATAVLRELAGFEGALFVGVSLVNIFSRPLKLPGLFKPCRDEWEPIAWWFSGEVLGTGDNPVLWARGFFEPLFLKMGYYGDVEGYLAQYGRSG